MKNIILYHYTNIDLKHNEKLTPKHFGSNYYTLKDINSCNVKRLFFYDTPKPEALLQGKRYLYTCHIAENKIYNITIDGAGYLKRYNSLYEAVQAIKRNYSGIVYTLGNYNVINLFYGIKPDTKREI